MRGGLYSATGWTLQTNATLATGTWGNDLGSVVNNSATNSLPAGTVFFRLKQLVAAGVTRLILGFGFHLAHSLRP